MNAMTPIETDATSKAAWSLVRTFRKMACDHDRQAARLKAQGFLTPVERRMMDEAIIEARRLRNNARWYLRHFGRKQT